MNIVLLQQNALPLQLYIVYNIRNNLFLYFKILQNLHFYIVSIPRQYIAETALVKVINYLVL